MEEQQQPRDGWPQWVAWWAAAFAVLSNVIGVAEVANANRFALSLVTGALAVGVGGFWLWRMFTRGGSSRLIFVVNLVTVVVGAGVLGGAAVGKWAVSGPVRENPETSLATERPAASTALEFQFPRFGNTFADGQDANGRVTQMPPGTQVWMFVRPQDGSTFSVQGPCETGDDMWICTKVRLTGPKGFHALMVVLVPGELGAQLGETRQLNAVPTGALATDEVVVQG